MLASRRFRPALIAATAFGLLVVLLTVTDPTRSPLVVLLLPFVLLFIVLYNSLLFMIHLLASSATANRHAKTVAIILGFEPVLLLLLASIDQLTVRDGILSLLLVCGFAWYVSRMNLSRR
jgi:hypothetical protein